MFQLGSISTGTLKTEDLLPAFIHELAIRNPDHTLYFDGEPSDMLREVDQDLQELCPPFVYFGAHPGDGADFGFWPDWDAIEEALQDPTHTLIDGVLYQVPRDEAVLVRQYAEEDHLTVLDLDRTVLWSTA